MPITVNWFDQSHTVVYMEFTKNWDWTDYHQATLDCVDLINSVPHQVSCVCDAQKSHPLPGGALQEVRRNLNRMPKNWSMTIVVPHTLFLQTILLTFQRIYPNYAHRFVLAQNLEDALDEINKCAIQL